MTPAPTDGEHVGALLREAREALGLDLQEIAAPLRIRLAYLQAIEDGRFRDLPGPTYAIGFVRTYADYMGMDSDALVSGYKASVGETAGHQELVFPTPVPEGRFPGGSVISLSVVLAVLAFGGWFFLEDRQVAEIGRVPPPPALAAVPNPTDPGGTAGKAGDAAATGPRADASAPSSPSARETAPAMVSADRPAATSLATSVASAATAEIGGTSDVGVAPTATGVASEAEATAPEERDAAPQASTNPGEQRVPPPARSTTADDLPEDGSTETNEVQVATAEAPSNEAVAVGAPTPLGPPTIAISSGGEDEPSLPAPPGLPEVPPSATGRVYGLANQDARIVLRAVADSWVQVRDRYQNVLLTRMLRSGDSYYVPNREDLLLLTGNAGGLEISVDGEVVPPLGPAGAVRRDVSLDVELLKAGRAAAR